jgi:hypothetical protein
MSELTIRIFVRTNSGTLVDQEVSFELSDFGGHLPAVGDSVIRPGGTPHSIMRPGATPQQPNHTMWTVVRRIFNPRDLSDNVALVVEDRELSDEERVFLPG